MDVTYLELHIIAPGHCSNLPESWNPKISTDCSWGKKKKTTQFLTPDTVEPEETLLLHNWDLKLYMKEKKWEQKWKMISKGSQNQPS